MGLVEADRKVTSGAASMAFKFTASGCLGRQMPVQPGLQGPWVRFPCRVLRALTSSTCLIPFSSQKNGNDKPKQLK